jgi:hypothetical protein
MNLTKGILISLVSVMALSQEGSAEKVGVCLQRPDFTIIKDNLTYYINPPRKFIGAEVGESREVKCEYNNTFAVVAIPYEYSFRTCNFNNEKDQKSCKSNNINDCVIYCDKRE